jgi:ribose 5-phosphate isomerase A
MSPNTLSPQTIARRAAAEAAVALVEPGMTVGLGTGDTAAHAIRAIAARQLSGLRCVATSSRSGILARELGLPLFELDDIAPPTEAGALPPIDLTIDGTDEVDAQLQLIKGGGGALLFEKLVAQASRRMVVIADEDKVVARIGDKRALPVEIVSFGARHTLQRIVSLPMVASAVLRPSGSGGEPFRTDSGHFIVDASLEPGSSAIELHHLLKMLLGVVETGLFCHEASLVFIGCQNGTVRTLARPSPKT